MERHLTSAADATPLSRPDPAPLERPTPIADVTLEVQDGVIGSADVFGSG